MSEEARPTAITPPAATPEPSTTAPPPEGFRRFLLLWGSQTLSLFGTFVSQFAVNVWLVRDLYPRPEQKPALALALTATGVAMTGPLIFGMPLAGAFADRHDRRRIMLAANLVSAIVTSVIVALLLAHRLTLPTAVVLLVVYALAGAFHSAAFDSSYALLVPAAQLPRANGMMMTSFGLSQLFAPPLAALLVGLPALVGAARLPAWMRSGVPFAFAADGLTFLVAAMVIAGMRIPSPPRRSGPRASLVADVREGFAWIIRRRPFLWLIANGSLANFTFAPMILLLPVLVRDRAALDSARLGMPFEAALAVVNTAGGVGGVVGGIAVSIWGLRGVKRRVALMAGCLVVLGVGEVLVGLSTTVLTMSLAMFLGELLVAPLNTASFTLWQTLTPPHILARALSVRRFLAQSAFPIGTVVAGWMATVIEPWVVVTLSGAALAVYCSALFTLPSFATLEDRMREAAARE